jgi:hypothetical protein
LFTLLLQVQLLCIKLLSSVVVSVFVSAKYNSLADKVKRIRTTTEALISSVKVVYATKRGDRGIVVSSVIKYEVT